MRRRLELGGAVLTAGCEDLTMHELIGVLVDGNDRIQGSATMRLAIGKRGHAWMAERRGAQQPSFEPRVVPSVH